MLHAIKLSTISTTPSSKVKKSHVVSKMESLTKQLSDIQEKLYAQHGFSVLIVLQGMDTSGKDSAVKQVFTGVNPAGCNVTSFKTPTAIELNHHFLWRISNACPQLGMIQIFNRSHYEDILVPMVNQTYTEHELSKRCEEIKVFEEGLVTSNTILIKFFLHVSQQEQFNRIKKRKENPSKQWKFNPDDLVDTERHQKYLSAYQFILNHQSTTLPWVIVPADKKWYKNYIILNSIVQTLTQYHFDYPGLNN
jgi:PPK2 family polyphosphate:nucleotide phosphotransferase